MIGKRVLQNRFTHHPPTTDAQVSAYETIRARGLRFATYLDQRMPDGYEKDEAVKHIEAAVMWANAGIARHEPLGQ